MSWRKVKLGKLVDNFSVRAKDVGGADGLDFFGVSNEVGITKTKYAAEDKAEDYKIIEQYCFAYNPYRVNVGSIGMVTENIKGLISPAYVVFKPKPNSIKAELLLKFLKSNEGLKQIRFYARGTVRQALRFEDLCNIELSLPNYDEQEILFQKLNSIEIESDILKTELSHQKDLLTQLRQAFLREAMQGKLVPQNPADGKAKALLQKIKAEKEKLIAEKKLKKEKDLPPIKEEEIPFEIPENWVWCRLGEICSHIFDMEHQMPNAVTNGGVMFLSAKDLLDNGEINYTNNVKHISEEDYNYLTRNFTPQKFDIIYSRRGANLGKSRIVETDLKYLASYSCCTIRTLNPCLDYINFLLDGGFILSQATKHTTNNSIPDLGVNKIKSFIVPLPPQNEQNRIVLKINELITFCNDLEVSIKQSELQNEKLLQQVLREALSQPAGDAG